MQIKKTIENGRMTFAVSGRLDTNTAPDLEAELTVSGDGELVFDFAGLEYISSAGLRVLLAAKKATLAAGRNMSVVNANETVRCVFEITGCGEMFGLV